MKQKLSVFSLLILSFVLLFSCLGFRRIASDTPEAREVYSRAAYDTYAEGIFASRESFPGLIVSIQADNDTLYGEENGLLSARYITVFPIRMESGDFSCSTLTGSAVFLIWS